jgi:hypothetical protein
MLSSKDQGVELFYREQSSFSLSAIERLRRKHALFGGWFASELLEF